MTDTLTRIKPALLAVAIVLGIFANCTRAQAAEAILAGGCFWCIEADFEKVKGVRSVVSGYTGGTVANPTYKQVVRGGTGHYEAVRIDYNPSQISYEQIQAASSATGATATGPRFSSQTPRNAPPPRPPPNARAAIWASASSRRS